MIVNTFLVAKKYVIHYTFVEDIVMKWGSLRKEPIPANPEVFEGSFLNGLHFVAAFAHLNDSPSSFVSLAPSKSRYINADTRCEDRHSASLELIWIRAYSWWTRHANTPPMADFERIKLNEIKNSFRPPFISLIYKLTMCWSLYVVEIGALLALGPVSKLLIYRISVVPDSSLCISV